MENLFSSGVPHIHIFPVLQRFCLSGLAMVTLHFKASFKENLLNKTLGRAWDPRANSAWLSKLTERNMKSLSKKDRELIRRTRRDDREAMGNEEREKRED